MKGGSGTVCLFACGDLMTGRGIDQVLPRSADPRIYEPWVQDARDYVALAEQRNGPIPRPVDYPYLWGEALEELARRQPDARLVNLETSVTKRGRPWPGKSIQYRMHPENLPLLGCAGIDLCVLANNHVLDWGYEGLEDTLASLQQAGLHTAGAGRDAAAATAPAVVPLAGRGRLVVAACGVGSSGIPKRWAASAKQAGVHLLPELSPAVAEDVEAGLARLKRPGDIAVISIHWGGNWGYEIPVEHRNFARRLLDGGIVDMVHGHSSHHPLGIEIYRGKLILYGCGDLITDYEGIAGHERFRGDLGLLYFARLDTGSGRLVALQMVPMTMRRFQLRRAARRDVLWLQETLNREGLALGTRVKMQEDGVLALAWECDA